MMAPSNNPLQRSGLDKVLGRGRGEAVLEQVLRGRALIGQWQAAERGRYTPRDMPRMTACLILRPRGSPAWPVLAGCDTLSYEYYEVLRHELQ